MTWLLTSTGRCFDLRLADASAITIEDVAHHLALLNRFTGATSRPYSVAEHSVHVMTLMRDEMGIEHPRALLAGLLHDAHEAYIGDLSTPLKAALDATSTSWRQVEWNVRAQVQYRFGVRSVAIGCARAIRVADLRMLATERRALMPPGAPDWRSLDGIEPSHDIWLEDYEDRDWRYWRDRLLVEYHVLWARVRKHQCGGALQGAAP